MRKLFLIIPPQVISIGQGWLERTPNNALVSCPYPDFPPSLGGALEWPHHVQLYVAAADGPRETRRQS